MPIRDMSSLGPYIISYLSGQVLSITMSITSASSEITPAVSGGGIMCLILSPDQRRRGREESASLRRKERKCNNSGEW